MCVANLITEAFLVFSHLNMYLNFRLLFNWTAKGIYILLNTKDTWKEVPVVWGLVNGNELLNTLLVAFRSRAD